MIAETASTSATTERTEIPPIQMPPIPSGITAPVWGGRGGRSSSDRHDLTFGGLCAIALQLPPPPGEEPVDARGAEDRPVVGLEPRVVEDERPRLRAADPAVER